MRHALGATLERPHADFHFHENGAVPTITPCPDELDLSLSHSRGLIGVVLASLPVGLDIEWLKRDTRPELQRYLNDDNDRTLLERYRNLAEEERFLYSWSLREAWYKAHPSHQSTATSALSLTGIEDSGWSAHAVRIADHLCVISTPEPVAVDLYYCTPFVGRRRIYPPVRRILSAQTFLHQTGARIAPRTNIHRPRILR